MWTYFVIFLSIFVFVGVFVRRLFLLSMKNRDPEDEKEEIKKPIAENDAVKISKKDADEVEVLFKKGEAMIKGGQDDRAIKYFVQALAIDKLHVETQQKLAVLYLQKEMYGASAALFEQLAELTHEPVHYSHLGLALYHQNELDAAKDAYQKAVDLDPSRPARFVSLSTVYRAMGQFQNAIIALNKALEMEEENMNFLLLLADLQMDMQNFDESIEISNRILNIDPKNEDAKKLKRSANRKKKEQDSTQ